MKSVPAAISPVLGHRHSQKQQLTFQHLNRLGRKANQINVFFQMDALFGGNQISLWEEAHELRVPS